MIDATTVEIPDGDDGTLATVEQMRALVNDRCSHPRIRSLTMRVIGLAAATTPDQQIARIRSWLRSHIRFVPDPDVTELLHDPVLLAEWIERDGSVGVDCDDVAMLGAAMGKSIGIPARFVVVGFFEPNAPFGHVWTELYDGTTWRELDTTRRSQGIEDGRITRRMVVDVATGFQGETMSGMVTTRRIGGVRPRGIGLEPVTTTATAISLYNTIKGLLSSSKEPDRIRQIQAAENLAMRGDAESLEFLRCRSVQGQTCTIEGYSEPIGGFATDTARRLAADAYNRVVMAQHSGGAPPPGSVTVTTPIGQASANTGALLLLGGLAFLALRRR